MSKLAKVITQLHGDGRAVMRDTQTGTEQTVIIGLQVGAGRGLVVFADESARDLPSDGPNETEYDPEAVNARANQEQERLRLQRTAEARGMSPEDAAKATAQDLFPEGQAPTAAPTVPATGYEQGIGGGVAGGPPDLEPGRPDLQGLDAVERAELEELRQLAADNPELIAEAQAKARAEQEAAEAGRDPADPDAEPAAEQRAPEADEQPAGAHQP